MYSRAYSYTFVQPLAAELQPTARSHLARSARLLPGAYMIM